MQTVILAGGQGARLGSETATLPKPMVTIGGEPLVWHIMNLFSHQGFDDFVIALGYKGDKIQEYLMRLALCSDAFTADLKSGQLERIGAAEPGWRVTAVETGSGTQTGGRIKRAARYVDDSVFMICYGDVLADLDLRGLVDFHHRHGRLATVAAVQPPAEFGYLDMDGGQVRRFMEKTWPDEIRINGGFFVVDKRVLDYIDGDLCVWEDESLTRLAQEGELMAYRHDGFWHSVETQRDRLRLEDKWNAGQAPWRRP